MNTFALILMWEKSFYKCNEFVFAAGEYETINPLSDE
jgi:hypothetical protein